MADLKFKLLNIFGAVRNVPAATQPGSTPRDTKSRVPVVPPLPGVPVPGASERSMALASGILQALKRAGGALLDKATGLFEDRLSSIMRYQHFFFIHDQGALLVARSTSPPLAIVFSMCGLNSDSVPVGDFFLTPLDPAKTIASQDALLGQAFESFLTTHAERLNLSQVEHIAAQNGWLSRPDRQTGPVTDAPPERPEVQVVGDLPATVAGLPGTPDFLEVSRGQALKPMISTATGLPTVLSSIVQEYSAALPVPGQVMNVRGVHVDVLKVDKDSVTISPRGLPDTSRWRGRDDPFRDPDPLLSSGAIVFRKSRSAPGKDGTPAAPSPLVSNLLRSRREYEYTFPLHGASPRAVRTIASTSTTSSSATTPTPLSLSSLSCSPPRSGHPATTASAPVVDLAALHTPAGFDMGFILDGGASHPATRLFIQAVAELNAERDTGHAAPATVLDALKLARTLNMRLQVNGHTLTIESVTEGGGLSDGVWFALRAAPPTGANVTSASSGSDLNRIFVNCIRFHNTPHPPGHDDKSKPGPGGGT